MNCKIPSCALYPLYTKNKISSLILQEKRQCMVGIGRWRLGHMEQGKMQVSTLVHSVHSCNPCFCFYDGCSRLARKHPLSLSKKIVLLLTCAPACTAAGLQRNAAPLLYFNFNFLNLNLSQTGSESSLCKLS